MQPKTIGKRSVDLAMTLLLLLLMARQITGETAHEWLGVGMFALWVAHHALNASWHRRLFRGRYTPFRVCQLVVNLLLLLAMVGTMVSGVVLSQTVFAFLPISGGRSWAQPLHILASFWGLVLMALHLGLHWGAILGQVRRQTNLSARPAAVGLAFAWPGGGGVWGVCVLGPPASSVPVRPGPLCLFRRGPAVGGVLPGLSGHPGAVRLAGPLRRKGAAGPGPAEKAAGVGSLGEKTAEPLGSAVMPVSDLFACR